MLTNALNQLLKGENLSANTMTAAMEALLTTATPEQAAAMMVLLRAKGETRTEISALVRAMQSKMTAVPVPYRVLDIVGTGGDQAGTVNISTAAALLAASCGVKVAKHGNRAVSSRCGSADVLEALGIGLQETAGGVLQQLESCGFGFCYAPSFHPAMMRLKQVRRQLGVPTIFNLLGPLLNPAGAEILMIGVAAPEVMSKMADVLIDLAVPRALVFHGEGLDELSCLGQNLVIEIENGTQQSYNLDPAQYGLAQCQLVDLQGGDASTNAALIVAVCRGEPNALADTICLNAGVANYLYGVSETIESGVRLARSRQRSGAMMPALNALRTSPVEV